MIVEDFVSNLNKIQILLFFLFFELRWRDEYMLDFKYHIFIPQKNFSIVCLFPTKIWSCNFIPKNALFCLKVEIFLENIQSQKFFSDS